MLYSIPVNSFATFMESEKPIGIFDSGLGGLTVLSAIRRKMPHENLIYFGDTARVPYGNKSKETIVRYSSEILQFLKQKNVKMVVVACNTASSHALDELKKEATVPVIGVVEPGIHALLRNTSGSKKAAVIATRSTINSHSYQNALKAERSDLFLYQKACPLFVPLIEEGFADKKLAEPVIREYLDELEREEIHDIILGCTHYPLIKHAISRLYPHFRLIDSSIETSESVLMELQKNGLENKSSTKGKIEIYASDITENLEDLRRLFFGESIEKMEKVRLTW